MRKVRKYLVDIKTAIDAINDFTSDINNLREFQDSKLVQRAVEREIEIIGEATNRILKIDPSINITNAKRIIDTRNFIIHGYDNVDSIIIWNIVDNHLTTLQREIIILLEE